MKTITLLLGISCPLIISSLSAADIPTDTTVILTAQQKALGRELLHAAHAGNKEQVERLLALEPTIVNMHDSMNIPFVGGMTPLMYACIKGHESIVDMLLAAGAQVNRENTSFFTAFMWATFYKHSAIQEKLIAAGATTIPSRAALGQELIYATLKGNKERVAAILSIDNTFINIQDITGNTALIQAASKGDTAIGELLIAAGADVNIANNDGKTALMRAASNGHNAIIEKLIAASANIDTLPEGGWTALMWATLSGHTSTVETLLHSKADVHIRTHEAETVLDIAYKINTVNPCPEIIELLEVYTSMEKEDDTVMVKPAQDASTL